MFRISHKILIDSPVDRVWAVTTDIERWHDWLPTVTAARRLSEGPFGPGSRYALKQPFQGAAIWEVTRITPGRSFTWRKTPGAQLRMLARHELVEHGESTLCRLSLVCSGPLAVWLRHILGPLFSAALVRENVALKSRCEAQDILSDTRNAHPCVQLKKGVKAT